MAESIPIKVETGEATAAIDNLGKSAADAADDFSGLTDMLNEFLKRRGAELGKPVTLFSKDDLDTLKAIRAEFQLLVRDTKGSGIGKQLSTQPGGAGAVRSPEQINGGLIESDSKKLQATLDKVLMSVLRRLSASSGKSVTGLTANELGATNRTGQHVPADLADPGTPPSGQAPPRTPNHPDTPHSKSMKVLGYAAQQLSPLGGGVVNQAASMGVEGMAGRGMGGMIAGGGMAGLAAGAGIGLAVAGIYKAASAVNEGIDREKVLATDIDKFRRSLGSTADSFSGLQDQSRMVGEQFNLSYEVSRKISTDFANIAKTNKGAVDQASEGVGLAQAVGVDEAQGAGFMAHLRKDQSIGDKKSDARIMGVQFAEALKRTGSTLNASELMSAIQGFSGDTAHRSLTAGNVEGYAGLLSAMVGSKTPGLDVGNASSLMARADASFQAGGGAGQASSTLQHMALGGDRIGLMGVKMRESAGMMATNDQVFGNPDNPVNKYTGGQMLQYKGSNTGMEDLIKMIKENSGGNKELEINTLSNHLKLNPNEAATFLNMEKEGKLGDTLAMSRQYKGVDLNKMSSDGYSMLSDVAHAKGDNDKLVGVRAGLGQRSDLSKDQRAQLTQMEGLSGGRLQDALVKFSTTLEREKTEGQKIQENATKTANATDLMANLLVPAAVKGNELLSALVEKLAPDSASAKKIEKEREDDQLTKMRAMAEGGQMSDESIAKRNTAYNNNASDLYSKRASHEQRVANAAKQIQELGDRAIPYKEDVRFHPEKEQEDIAIWAEAQAAAKKNAAESMIRNGGRPGAPTASKSDAAKPGTPIEVRRKTQEELAAEAVPATPTSSQGAGSNSPTKTGRDGVVTPEMRAKMLANDAELAKVNPGWRPGMTEAQIKQESGFNPTAVSSAGAYGYTQIMPGTRKLFEAKAGRKFKPGDFDDDLELHRLHMTGDLKREGNVPDALRAYNGSPNFRRSKSAENRNYAGDVYSNYDALPQEAKRIPAPITVSPATARGLFAATDPRRLDREKEEFIEPAQVTKPVPIPAGNPQSTEQAKSEQQRVNVAFANQKHSIDVNVHSGNGADRQAQSHQVAWVSKPKASGTLATA